MNKIISSPDIGPLIHFIRGQKVMLDSDLARIYGVSTARLNQQVKRNRKRFPEDFAFRLTEEEYSRLMLQTATSSSGRGGPSHRGGRRSQHPDRAGLRQAAGGARRQ